MTKAAEQTLEALGLSPIDGIATCPACDRRTLKIDGFACSGGCRPSSLVTAFEMLANVADTVALRELTIALSGQIRAQAEAPLMAEFPRSDLGNARRFVAQHRENTRYVSGVGWAIWNEEYWARNTDGAIDQLGKKTVDEMYSDGLRAIEDARDLGEKAQGAALKQFLFARASQSQRSLGAMVSLAATEPEVVTRVDALDADPMLLTCGNGTVDLRTGMLREHRRGDLITRATACNFDAGATCPRWDRFLSEIFAGDADLIAFFQRALGYTLTGRTDEQVIFLLHGAGANGKSTAIEVLRTMLGDHATHVDFATFLVKDRNGGAARTDLVRLRGVRMATASELDAGERLNERLVKELTGGEPVTARALYQAEIEFRPIAKFWWSSNNLPVVRGQDEGIWRRLRLIPFSVTFAAGQRDPGLRDALAAELPGILAWAVRGCLEWQRVGLGQAAKVQAATSAFRGESDQIGRFVAEACVTGDDCRSTRKAIRAAYERWCDDQAERPAGPRVLWDALRRLGARDATVRDENGPGNGWAGIGLTDFVGSFTSVGRKGSNSHKTPDHSSYIEEFREKPSFSTYDSPELPTGTSGKVLL